MNPKYDLSKPIFDIQLIVIGKSNVLADALKIGYKHPLVWSAKDATKGFIDNFSQN
jgi:hypothetical protein